MLHVTLKRVVCYFDGGGVVLWRGWCVTLKMGMCCFDDSVFGFLQIEVIMIVATFWVYIFFKF